MKRVQENTRRSNKLSEMSVAERVLEEYAWREHNLNARDIDPFDLEELIYAVAAECRSEIGFAIHSWLNNQTAEARRRIYSLFLAILENTPSSLPRLRMSKPPRKGQHWDGWAQWGADRTRARYGPNRENR
jgi:hypothetical protein